MTHQPLDDIPLPAIALLVLVATLALYEIGYRIGRSWAGRSEDEVSGPTSMIVGSILALMAFLLAISMGMAADRFDARRALVLQEANAIGTTFLRAGYLPEPYSTELQDLLREYVPLRIVSDEDQLHDQTVASEEIQREMWRITEELTREHGDRPTVAIFIESLNETIDLHESRVTARLYARVPPTVIWLLIGGGVLGVGMVGYNAGLTKRRGMLSAIALAVALSAVITLVVDLDRPTDGIIRTNQQPLVDLRESLE